MKAIWHENMLFIPKNIGGVNGSKGGLMLI